MRMQQIFEHHGITSALIGGVLLSTSLCAFAESPRTVSGSLSYTTPSDGVAHLDFQAVELLDGTVIGEAHSSLLHDVDFGYHAHLRIDCMHFLDDHTVILGGVDFLDSDPEFVGNTVVFAVRDNGEGQDSVPDQRTEVYFSGDVGFEVNCEVALGLIESGQFDLEANLLSAETGDIQVRP